MKYREISDILENKMKENPPMKNRVARRCILALLILLLLIPPLSATATPETADYDVFDIEALLASPPNVTARSAIAMDFATGEVLFGRDIDTRRPLASMTKNMTAFIVYEEIAAGRLTLNTRIRVGQNAVNLSRQHDWHPATVFHTVGAEHSVETMLRLIMLPSHNGACVAMAEHISGSVPAFVNRMNSEAQRLGLNAVFADSHGGAANQTSARAMATLVRTFITDHPDILRITRMTTMQFAGATVPNTNLLLPGRDFFYQGADGFKTGTSGAAGHNLSATAMRDGRRVVTVVMNAPNNSGRYGDTRALFNFGFAESARRQAQREAEQAEREAQEAAQREAERQERIRRMNAVTVDVTANVSAIRLNEDFTVTARLNNVNTGDIQALGGGWTINGRTVSTFGPFTPTAQRSFTLPYWLPADSTVQSLEFGFFFEFPENIRRSGTLTLRVSDAPPLLFRDIRGHWAETDIVRVVDENLFSAGGIGQGRFGPEEVMNRAMFVTALGRVAREMGIELTSEGVTPFVDVAADTWYSGYVAWAWEAGLVQGMSDTHFGTYDPVTRQQVAVFFYRFMDIYNIELTLDFQELLEINFTDAYQVDEWAYDAVAKIVGIGLMRGHTDGSFAPRDAATRSQMAALILRFLDAGPVIIEPGVPDANIAGSWAFASAQLDDGTAWTFPEETSLNIANNAVEMKQTDAYGVTLTEGTLDRTGAYDFVVLNVSATHNGEVQPEPVDFYLQYDSATGLLRLSGLFYANEGLNQVFVFFERTS